MVKNTTSLKGLNILLGVSGGIAAYKAVDLASKLVKAAVVVKTVMTANACELVGAKSFEGVTGSSVYTNLWSSSEEYKIGHVNLVDWTDIIVVAPATANIIGKIASGICDDLLSTLLCAGWQKPVLLAPAMNDKMWNNPAVKCNVKIVSDMGFDLIGPEKGRLACGAIGAGRMAEPDDILNKIKKMASEIKRTKK